MNGCACLQVTEPGLQTNLYLLKPVAVMATGFFLKICLADAEQALLFLRFLRVRLLPISRFR